MNVITLAREEIGYFEIFIRKDGNGDFINADTPPSFKIFSPDDVELAVGISTIVSQGVYSASWEVPISAIASNKYYIKWSVVVNKISHEIDEYFTVVESKNYQGYISTQSTIIVPESYMRQIKSCIGYPLQETIILDDNQIKDLCIERALKKYFIKFPIEEIQNFTTAGGSLEVDFPDDDTFGILDIGIVNRGYNSDISPSNFWSIYGFNKNSPTRKIKKYGTNYSFSIDAYGEMEADSQILSSFINKATVNYNVDVMRRKVKVFSEIGGTCQIKWAKKSNNFSHVSYEQVDNVVMLAQAYLLENLADISGITENPDDEKFDTASLKEKATERFEKVQELWNGIPDIIVIS